MTKPADALRTGLDLDQLRVLESLLRTHSTVQSARELGVTQSAVSHTLRRLRHALADPLFVRVGRSLVATERASALRARVDDALRAIERVVEEPGVFDPFSARGEVRIIAGDYAELVILPPLLAVLASEAPGIDLVFLDVGDRLEEALQRGEADLALGGFFRERANLVLRPLFHDPFVVVTGAQGAPKRMTMGRYLEARHVIASPRGLPGGIVDTRLGELGLARRVVLRTPTFQTALAMAARTDLLMTAPRRLAQAYATGAPVRLLTPPLELPPVRFAMLYAESRRSEALHHWIRGRIVALFSALERPRGINRS